MVLQSDLQPGRSEPPNATQEVKDQKKHGNSNKGIPLSELLVGDKQPNDSEEVNANHQSKEFLSQSSSELLNQPTKVDNIEKSTEHQHLLTTSSSLCELSIVEENNHPIVPAISSESPDDNSRSSLNQESNQNSPSLPQELTGAALARRLNVSPSTLRHKKNARDFGRWTKGHDPDGIAWSFDGQKFTPKTESNTQ